MLVVLAERSPGTLRPVFGGDNELSQGVDGFEVLRIDIAPGHFDVEFSFQKHDCLDDTQGV